MTYDNRMDIWTALAESRIREWQERSARGDVSRKPPVVLESLEGQLLKDILRLRLMAHAQSDDAERKLLLRKAEDLRIRLMITLEPERPLLAQMINAKLASLSRPESDEP